jgi:hypothetical protein
MRLLHLAPALAGLSWLALAAPQSLPPAQDAAHYPAFVRHSDEHITIAVDPYDTGERNAVFHLNYVTANILPVRIIITNDGNTPISLEKARIDFITAAGDKIPAAEPADVERALDRPPDPRKKVQVGPFKIGGKGKNRDKNIEEDFKSFEYSSLIVEPHTTHSGFLFYDLADLADPLRNAHLELRRIQDSAGHELFAFEVPFDKYLASKK